MSAEYVSVRSASLLLDGIDPGTIYAAVKDGELPAARFGKPPKKDETDHRRIRISRTALLAWADSKTQTPAA